MTYNILSAQVFNVGNSRKQFENMLDVAWQATKKMKQNGETDFSVNIQSEKSTYSLETVCADAYKRFRSIANDCAIRKVEVRDMTEEEKFSIAVASGVPLEPIRNKQTLVFNLRTARPCGIVSEPDGEIYKYTVYVQPERLNDNLNRLLKG